MERLFESVDDSGGTTEVTWFVGIDDSDDQTYPERDGVHYVRSPKNQLAVKTNELAALTWDDFPILAQIDDDQWPRTPGWDQQIITAMDRLGGGLIYPNDGWMGEQTPVVPFWPSRFAKRLGWLYHPELIHLFCDNVLKELAIAINRIGYLPDVLIEHCHPIVKKNDWDDIYAESNSGEMWSHDEAVFKAYIGSDQFQADTAALKGMF
jgi:hypothetical protein